MESIVKMTYRPYSAIISEAQSGAGSSSKTQIENQSGSAIPVLYPVSVDSNGYGRATDTSIEIDSMNCAGVTSQNIADSSIGDIYTSGKIENVSGFSFGDTIYVAKSGGLTNIKPDIGTGGFAAGDYVIRIGVIARSAINPSNKDLLLSIRLVGQL